MPLASLVRSRAVVPRQMMSLLPPEHRDVGAIGWQDWLSLMQTSFTYDGIQYVVPGASIAEMTAFQGKQDPIVFACMALRAAIFGEVRMQYQSFSNGRPSKLFGLPSLALLEKPWPTGTTRDVMSRAEWDISLYGNSYWVAPNGDEMMRLDPAKVKIATADVGDSPERTYSKRLIGYIVEDSNRHEVKVFLADEVLHYKPIPDPDHPFRGQSWLSTILAEIGADMDLTVHKRAFLANAATPALVVKMPAGVGEEVMTKFRDRMESRHTSPRNAFKTLYVSNGADIVPVGANFEQMAFNLVQSAGETRIAAAAGCPPALLGISEGLRGSTLNSGNFTSVARSFADRTLRPLWGAWCGVAETLCRPPAGARLWYVENEVPFLQADETDAAKIRMDDAATMLSLVNSGYEPLSVRDAVVQRDWNVLTWIGLPSVQLQPSAAPDDSNSGGSGDGSADN